MFHAGGYAVVYNEDKSAILDIHPSEASVSGEAETADGLGIPWEPGAVQVLASAQTSSTISLSMNFQVISKANLAFIMNTQLATLASIDVPHPFQATVPATPFEVTITGLSVDQDVTVNVVTKGDQRKLTQVTGATAIGANQYKVAANKITFHSGEEGELVTGVYKKAVTNKKAIGGPTAGESFGTVEFYGRVLGTEDNVDIWIPQWAPNGAFDLGLIGNAGEDTTVEGTISTPQGWNRPYLMLFD